MSEWLTGATAVAVRVVGIVLGVAIMARSARLRRSAGAGAGAGSMIGSRAYLAVVALEVVALVAGALVLGSLGEGAYVPACYAAVVGAPFLAFGHFFHASFYWLGAALLVGGLAATLVGLSGGGQRGVEVTSGLIAAASLLTAGGWKVLAPSRWALNQP